MVQRQAQQLTVALQQISNGLQTKESQSGADCKTICHSVRFKGHFKQWNHTFHDIWPAVMLAFHLHDSQQRSSLQYNRTAQSMQPMQQEAYYRLLHWRQATDICEQQNNIHA